MGHNHTVTPVTLCDFILGLIGKPKLCTKFEIASFSYSKNMKGRPQNFGSSSTFSPEWDFIMGLGEPQLHANFEVASFSHCRNIKRKSQNFGEDQDRPTFSCAWEFIMGLGNLQPHTNFDVASFSQCRNIKGEPQILGSSPNLGPFPLFFQV